MAGSGETGVICGAPETHYEIGLFDQSQATEVVLDIPEAIIGEHNERRRRMLAAEIEFDTCGLVIVTWSDDDGRTRGRACCASCGFSQDLA